MRLRFPHFFQDASPGLMLPLGIFLVPLFGAVIGLPLRFLVSFIAAYFFEPSQKDVDIIAAILLVVSLLLGLAAYVWLWREVKKHHYSDTAAPQDSSLNLQDPPEMDKLWEGIDKNATLKHRKHISRFLNLVIFIGLCCSALLYGLHLFMDTLAEAPWYGDLIVMIPPVGLLSMLCFQAMRFHYQRNYSLKLPGRPILDGTQLNSGRVQGAFGTVVFLCTLLYGACCFFYFASLWIWASAFAVLATTCWAASIPFVKKMQEIRHPTSVWIKKLKKEGEL